MASITEIIEFIHQETGLAINEDFDITGSLGVYGDDFFDLMEAFSVKFGVNMDNFLWYFHSGDEGVNFPGRALFKPPYEHVKRIPITPTMLCQFANARYWNLNYPPHHIPKKRFDLLINRIFFGAISALILLILFLKYCYGTSKI